MPSEIMQLTRGDFVGEYRILDVIGDGGFSIVYKAEDVVLRREVAIKQLRAEAFKEDGSLDWFIREAQLTASLNHPNIVHIYTLREEGDSWFLVMEYLPGDLHSLLKENGPLERTIILKIASDICHALETLHSRDVIHRDIKPENILIAQPDHFKLADFGLAHVHPARWHGMDDSSGPQPGTLLYMSPEQAFGREITPRSDIYSLAVVLYEAITGHYYFKFNEYKQSEDTLLDLIANAAPLPIKRTHPTVPADIAEPILRALSKDPALRPPTARAFLGDLKNAISRSKHSTLSQKRRPLEPQKMVASTELLRQLYAIRTRRDADHQPEQALEQLRVIWQTSPGVPEVAAEWGETLIALGRIEEGRNWLDTAVRLNPELPFAQLALADLYRNVDDNDDAAEDALVQAIHADVDLAYAVLYEDIEEALGEPEKFQEYVDLFQRAASERATAPILVNLGQVLSLDKTRVRDGIAAFEAAVHLDPDYGPAYVGLSSLLIEHKRLNEAIALLEQATYAYFPNLSPDEWHKTHTIYQRPHAFLALAVTYAQVGQYESSAVAARSVFDMDRTALEEDAPALLVAYLQAAQNWIKQDDYLRAYRLLNQAIPLAAHWGNQEVFSLIESIQNKVDEPHRRKRQWDDAVDWLKTSLVNIRHTSPNGGGT